MTTLDDIALGCINLGCGPKIAPKKIPKAGQNLYTSDAVFDMAALVALNAEKELNEREKNSHQDNNDDTKNSADKKGDANNSLGNNPDDENSSSNDKNPNFVGDKSDSNLLGTKLEKKAVPFGIEFFPHAFEYVVKNWAEVVDQKQVYNMLRP